MDVLSQMELLVCFVCCSLPCWFALMILVTMLLGDYHHSAAVAVHFQALSGAEKKDCFSQLRHTRSGDPRAVCPPESDRGI